MKTHNGLTVRTTDREVYDPEITALLVVDVQNDFASPEGHLAQRNPAGFSDLSDIAQIIPRIADLVVAARAAGVRVVWLQHTLEPDGSSDSPAWLEYNWRVGKAPVWTVRGTWGHEIVAALQPLPSDLFVSKYRSGGFANSELDRILRREGIESVVCCGLVTEGCVESTVRDSTYYDYYASVVSDCVASTRREWHEASLLFLRSRYRVYEASYFKAVWNEATVPGSKRAIGTT